MGALPKLGKRAAKIIFRWPEFVRCVFLTPAWLQWSQKYAFHNETAFPAEFRTRSGLRIPLNDWSELTTVWRVFLSNEYLVPKASMRIIDAGANIGAFSLYLAQSRPEASLVALEPFPETFERLTRTIELNGLQDRITPMRAAMASRRGTASFDGRQNVHSYCRRIVNEADSNAIHVDCVAIGDVLDQMGWDECDYLKMDIEGGEYEALLNVPHSMLRRVKAIGLEYHDSKKFPALMNGMKEAGFRCERNRPAGWSGLSEFRRI